MSYYVQRKTTISTAAEDFAGALSLARDLSLQGPGYMTEVEISFTEEDGHPYPYRIVVHKTANEAAR